MSWTSRGSFRWADALRHDPLPVGGIAVALMLGTYALLQIPVSIPLLVAGGCGAGLVYGFDRGVVRSPEDEVNHPERRRWMEAHRRWLTAEIVLFGIGGGGALAWLRGGTVLGAAALAVPAGLHLLPIGRQGRLLRTMGVAKPIAVAGAWAVGGTLLPVLEANAAVDAPLIVLAGYRMCFILPNVLLADWGDRRGDVAAGLRPWAKGATRRGLRWAATALLCLAATGAVSLAWMTAMPLLLCVDAAGLLFLFAAVWMLRPSRPDHRLLMDGIIAWPLVTALAAWALGGAA